RYVPGTYTVEGDYSSASYWFALAAVCGGSATVTGLNPYSEQGDQRFTGILEQMGCERTVGSDSVTIRKTRILTGVTVDMADCPDVVQTLCMVAATASTQTRITGIHHLRMKESDRIEAVARGLSELGGNVETGEDFILIRPAPLHRGTIHPENDHRTAMSFAILGCCTGAITILDAGCVTKSYPGFWEELKRIWQTAV
ncbi:MAG: 3-phosphoshikimate 1-carboxyvinyltransferase, partial [Methanospirillum sp.]|nr:3-phosphoshikimate 1-carboxyvinyltransferase [Methanospirillum sp.]